MEFTELTVDTASVRVVDLTEAVRAFCEPFGDGLLSVFAPHATAGLALMEPGDGSERDLEDALERLLPRDDRYRHREGATGHGADHILATLISPSLMVPVRAGEPLLGTWQHVVLVDLSRNHRQRTVRLSFLAG